MIFSAVRTLADARSVLDRAGHQGGAVLVDALHLRRSGGTPADLAAVPARLLPYAQLCDAPTEPARPVVEEARTGRLLPGDGDLPLGELVDALPPDADLAVEAPVISLRALPAAERARLAYATLRRVAGPS